MPYTKNNWVDGSSPDLDAANLNNMEAGIAAAPYGPDAGATFVPVADGSGGWTYIALTNAQIAAAAGIAYSKLALTGSVVNADIASDAAIVATKLAGDILLSQLHGYPSDGTKFPAGDGTWKVPPSSTITYRKTTAKAVNTTISPTDLLNGEITLAANDLGTSKHLRAVLIGDMLNNTGASQVPPRFQLVVGGVTIFDSSALAADVPASATRGTWRCIIEAIELGATNAQLWSIDYYLVPPTSMGNTSATSAAFTTGTGTQFIVSGNSNGSNSNFQVVGRAHNTSALDATGTLAFVFNVINGSNSASYETRLQGAALEIV